MAPTLVSAATTRSQSAWRSPSRRYTSESSWPRRRSSVHATSWHRSRPPNGWRSCARVRIRIAMGDRVPPSRAVVSPRTFVTRPSRSGMHATLVAGCSTIAGDELLEPLAAPPGRGSGPGATPSTAAVRRWSNSSIGQPSRRWRYSQTTGSMTVAIGPSHSASDCRRRLLVARSRDRRAPASPGRPDRTPGRWPRTWSRWQPHDLAGGSGSMRTGRDDPRHRDHRLLAARRRGRSGQRAGSAVRQRHVVAAEQVVATAPATAYQTRKS